MGLGFRIQSLGFQGLGLRVELGSQDSGVWCLSDRCHLERRTPRSLDCTKP